MQIEKPRIELYRVRTFSEKISDTFDFIRESWRPLLKYFVYLMLPLSIVLAFFVNNFSSGYMSALVGMSGSESFETSQMVTFILMMVGTGVVSCIVVVLLMALVYALIRIYQVREERLQGLTYADLRPELFRCASRAVRLLLGILLVTILLCVLIGLLVFVFSLIHPVAAAISLFFVYVASVVVIIPLSLVVPVYMLEDDLTLLEAFQKAWRLGFATWGGIFAVSFVLGLIGFALQMLTWMPWYVMQMAKSYFTLQGEGGGFAGSAGYSLILYLAAIWMCLGYLLVTVLSTVGLTVQYGHASDKIDGMGVARKIEKFDELDKF